MFRLFELDRRKSDLLSLLDICQRIVDEQTFPRGSADPLQKDVEDFGVRLDMPDLA